MNKYAKIFIGMAMLFYLGATDIQSNSVVNAENVLTVNEELRNKDYTADVYDYEIKQADMDSFLDRVAKHHNLNKDEFDYNSIAEISMEALSYEGEEFGVRIAKVENSMSYGYTASDSAIYYDLQNVIKENNLDVASDEALGFASKDEIQEHVEKLIKDLGIELEYSIEIKSITADNLQIILNEYFNFDDTEVSNSFVKDLYTVSVQFYIDSIPINSFAMGDYESGIVAEDTVFQLTFSEDGLENADLRGYNAIGEENEMIHLNSEEIISLIEDKYNNILILNDTQLSTLDLVYLNLLGSKENNNRYIPVWLGIVEQTVDDQVHSTYIFIDANTNREITLY